MRFWNHLWNYELSDIQWNEKYKSQSRVSDEIKMNHWTIWKHTFLSDVAHYLFDNDLSKATILIQSDKLHIHGYETWNDDTFRTTIFCPSHEGINEIIDISGYWSELIRIIRNQFMIKNSKVMIIMMIPLQ